MSTIQLSNYENCSGRQERLEKFKNSLHDEVLKHIEWCHDHKGTLNVGMNKARTLKSSELSHILSHIERAWELRGECSIQFCHSEVGHPRRVDKPCAIQDEYLIDHERIHELAQSWHNAVS